MPPSHNAFGDFLRSRREKLSPQAAGLPSGRRRRTPGLRREEVAELAGIGIDWYIRLEQGRTVTPSAATIDALAAALRLGNTEHAHLRALTRRADPRHFATEAVPDPIRHMVEALPHPAYVAGRRWDMLACNAAAAELFGFCATVPEPRNILVWMLTDPAARRLFGAGWPDEAKRMVAVFRTTHDLWGDDPAFMALLATLRDGCGEFAPWWDRHDIRTVAAGRKTFHHPARGVIRYEHASFQSNDDPRLKLVIYTPV